MRASDRTRRSVALSLLVGTTIAVSAAAQSLAGLDEKLAAGMGAVDLGEPELAESLLRDALLEGWLLLGDVHARNGQLQAARGAYETASTVAVATNRALTSLALVDLRLDHPERAIGVLRRVLAEAPGNEVALRLLARSLVAAGSLREAAQTFRELRVAAPGNLEDVYALATLYLQLERSAEAQGLLAELADARPAAPTQILIGRTYRDHGDYQRARAALQRALSLDATVARARFYLGTVELLDKDDGNLEQAIAEFKAALSNTEQAEVVNFHLGLALVEARRFDEAVGPLQAAASDDSLRRDALKFLGQAFLRQRQPSQALKALEESLRIETEEENSGRARSQSEGVRLRRLSGLHYLLAQAHRGIGDETTAAFHLQASERLTANLAERSKEELADYLQDVDGSDDRTTIAIEVEAPASDSQRADAVVRALSQRLATAYLHLGSMKLHSAQAQSAVHLLEKGNELAPEMAAVQKALAIAYFNVRQFRRAAEELTLARDTDPDNPNLEQMLAMALLNSNQPARAAAVFEQFVDADSAMPLQYAHGLALVRSGQGVRAEAIFDRLLAGNRESAELHVALAQAYASQDNYEAAEVALRRALDLDPGAKNAHTTRGEMNLRRGRLDEAEADLRQELSRYPDETQPMQLLATVLELAAKPSQALEVLERLVERDPRMAAARYLMGKILLSEGRNQEAIAHLRAAANLDPEDSSTRYQLGRALAELGDAEGAEREFAAFRALKEGEES